MVSRPAHAAALHLFGPPTIKKLRRPSFCEYSASLIFAA